MSGSKKTAVPTKSVIVLLVRSGLLSFCLNLILLLSVFAFSSAADAQAVAFLVRHADRLDWSEDTRLSEAGEERARRLAGLLKDAGITAIYATEFQRTQKTAEPLARMLNIRPMIFNHADLESPVERIKRQKQNETALIVGHDSTVPGHAQTIRSSGADHDRAHRVR